MRVQRYGDVYILLLFTDSLYIFHMVWAFQWESYYGNIRPICPKFSCPEIFFEKISVFLENPFSRNTFDGLCDVFWRFHRNRLDEKVNMIKICSNFMESNLKWSGFYFFHTNTSEFFIQLSKTKYFSSILYWAHQMIQAQVYIMSFMNVCYIYTEK